MSFEGIESVNNDFLDLLISRRSIRKFKSKDVPDTYIKTLIEAAHLAPSRANTQPWHFVIIKNQYTRKLLSVAAKNQKVVAEAPLIIGVFSLINTEIIVSKRTEELVNVGTFNNEIKNEADHAFDNLNQSDKEVDPALNASIAATTLMYQAHQLGLGCCWVKLIEDTEVLKILNVPSGYYHAGLLAIGFPDENPKMRPRIDISNLIHFEQFNKMKSKARRLGNTCI